MRLRDEGGFLMIEVTAAMAILSIALMALMAGYDSAFISLHKSSQKATAATLANQQLGSTAPAAHFDRLIRRRPDVGDEQRCVRRAVRDRPAARRRHGARPQRSERGRSRRRAAP
jgi:type II secretory pathway component PulJ